MKNKTLITLTLGLAVMMSSFALYMAPAPVPALVSYEIDVKSSEIRWTGYHLAKSYSHTGHIQIVSGNLQVDDGNLVGGEIIIDMNSITDEDLEDEKNNI